MLGALDRPFRNQPCTSHQTFRARYYDYKSLGSHVNWFTHSTTYNGFNLYINITYKYYVVITCVHVLCIMFMFIFSVPQQMDDEGKHDVHSETHLQVSDAACEHSGSADSDIEQNKMYSAFSSDCEMSADFSTHRVAGYNVLQGITCAHERPEDVQTGDVYSRQVDGIHGHTVKCLISVQCEEHRQELNEQSHVLPASSTDQETNWTNDANEIIQVKQEKKECTDGYDRSSEVTRHWIVCPGGVLKEVKAEHASDVPDVLSGEDCSVNGGHKLCTRTCSHHNNIHDEEINWKLGTDSSCAVASTRFRRHDNVMIVQEIMGKVVKPFTVDTYGKQFAHLSELKLRERTHLGDQSFICDTCGKSFARLGDLNGHEMTHTGVKPLTCDTCGKSFTQSGDLKKHEMVHTGVKPFTCDTCGKSFVQSLDLKKHELLHTGVKPFICDTCGKSFPRLGDLNGHEMTHTGVKPFTCDICGKSFAHSGHLNRHDMVHTGVKPFTCDTCGKSFTQSGHLNIHELVHTGVKPFTCDTCGKSFNQSGALKRHEMIHAGVKPFTCDTCGKSFYQSGSLSRHKMIHSGVKPFTCDICVQSFVRSGALKRHEMVHTGVKPFTCGTCGKSFAQLGDLNIHERTHTGVKPFTCDTCGKSFTQSGALKRHEMIHTGVKPFTCDTCGKSFSRSGNLKQHEMRHECIKPFTYNK